MFQYEVSFDACSVRMASNFQEPLCSVSVSYSLIQMERKYQTLLLTTDPSSTMSSADVNRFLLETPIVILISTMIVLEKIYEQLEGKYQTLLQSRA